MITQDIEKKVLERLSLADEVSKYGTIVDNPGDEVWPFKAECLIPHSKLEDGKRMKWFEKITVLLSKSQKTFLIDDEDRRCAGDALEFIEHACLCRPRWNDFNIEGHRGEFARKLAICRHWNVWEE